MNKKELVEALARKELMSKKDAEDLLLSLEEVLLEGLKTDGKVSFLGGKLKITPVNAKESRKAKHPKTGEVIEIPAKPASKKLSFKVGNKMKETIAKL